MSGKVSVLKQNYSSRFFPFVKPSIEAHKDIKTMMLTDK